jgi:ribosomal-protein-alanine N-acetyltransferase
VSGRDPTLLLRPPVPDDAAPLFAIYGDPRTNRHNPAGPYRDRETAEMSIASWINHWNDHGFGSWAIALPETPETVIGFGGIRNRLYGDVERLNLGYRFAVEAWGRGYATDLGRAALTLAFDNLGRDEVMGLVRPDNLASIRVLEKLGMTRDGELDDFPGLAKSLVYSIRNPAALAA